MSRFNQDIFPAAGVRTPFARGGCALSRYDGISLSVPVVRAMAEQLADGRPDLVLWGTGPPCAVEANNAESLPTAF